MIVAASAHPIEISSEISRCGNEISDSDTTMIIGLLVGFVACAWFITHTIKVMRAEARDRA